MAPAMMFCVGCVSLERCSDVSLAVTLQRFLQLENLVNRCVPSRASDVLVAKAVTSGQISVSMLGSTRVKL